MSGVERRPVRDRLVEVLPSWIGAAEESKLADAIMASFVVVPREDLPEVEERDDGRRVVVGLSSTPIGLLREQIGVDSLRSEALEYLALAEWLDAHPPVDPAVEAIRSALWGLRLTGDADVDARTLAAAGLRVDTESGGHDA